MAELGVVASIVNVVDLASKVTIAAAKYAEKVKNVSADMARIQSEVQHLHDVLQQLHEKSQNANISNAALKQWQSFAILDNKEASLVKSRTVLNSLLKQLDYPRLSRMDRLLWPVKVKKLERDLEIVTSQKNQYLDILSIDIASRTTDIDLKVSDIAQRIVDNDLWSAIRWLSSLDHTADHYTACDQRTELTGQWLIDRSEFRTWKKEGGLFWLRGAAGAGKTILTSLAIESVMKECEKGDKTVVSYFYFKDIQRYQPVDMFRSILVQLCARAATIPENVARMLQNSYRTQAYPNKNDLVSMLSVLVKDIDRAYIFIDALDECMNRDVLFKLLSDTLNACGPVHLACFVSSRDLVEFRREITDMCTAQIPIGNYEKAGDHANAEDIRRFVKASIAERYHLKTQTDDVKEKITNTLTERAGGMFRWVACQIDLLSEPLMKYEILEALNDLPKDLDETYERMLQSIKNRKNGDRHAKLVHNIFRWLAVAQRPLYANELAQAIVQEPKNVSLTREVPTPDLILEICGNLIVMARNKNQPMVTRNIRNGVMSGKTETPTNWGITRVIKRAPETMEFSHFSVKEYLISSRILESPCSSFAVNEELTSKYVMNNCLSFVLSFDQDDFDAVKAIKEHPLLEYSCDHWPAVIRDARAREQDPLTEELLARLFDIKNANCFQNWASIYDPIDGKQYDFKQQARSDTSSPLVYTAKFYLNNLTTQLLEEGIKADALPNHKHCPLQMASIIGNERSVRELLKYGADVNNFGFIHHTALIAATKGKNDVIARLLIEKGIEIDEISDFNPSALAIAVEYERHDIVDLLISHKADPNLMRDWILPPLHHAIEIHNQGMVRKLLESGADPSLPGLQGTALHVACEASDLEIMSLLLEYGADINLWSRFKGFVLDAAILAEKTNIVELLLARGADPNTETARTGSPLHCAISVNSMYLFRLLLSYGADPKSCISDQYGSVPQYAAEQGAEEIIVLLLELKAIDLEPDEDRWGKPLYSALESGHHDIVKLFVNESEYEQMLEKGYGTALHGAAYLGEDKLLGSLIAKGMDLNASGKFGSALQAACCGNQYSAVNILLDAGADVNMRRGEYETALQAACVMASYSVIELLASRSELDINASGGRYGAALHALPSRDEKLFRESDVMPSEVLAPELLNLSQTCLLSDAKDMFAVGAPKPKGMDRAYKLLLHHGENQIKCSAEYDSTHGEISTYCTQERSRSSGNICKRVNLHVPPHGCPLMAACTTPKVFNTKRCVKALVSHGANVNCHCSAEYGSPLQAIVRLYPNYGTAIPIKTLLKAGADPFFKAGEEQPQQQQQLQRDNAKGSEGASNISVAEMLQGGNKRYKSLVADLRAEDIMYFEQGKGWIIMGKEVGK